MITLPKSLTLPPDTRLARGASQQLLALCDSFGNRGVLVCGQSQVQSGNLDRILDGVSSDVEVRVWLHPGNEPTLDQLEELLVLVREHDARWVAAVGGGSVVDIAKAAAGLHHAPLAVAAYHDGATIPASWLAVAAYHDGATIPASSTPFIAVPTTAGTGSEATTVSVLTNADTGVKKSIRHPSFMARLVILDPELLATCPKDVLAASGMDALTQAVESYCSNGATWLTDTLALKSLELVHQGLLPAHGGDAEAYPALLTGSYLAGIALTNARLGLVHGLAHPLGARFHVPHGLVCAVCLPHVAAYNREALGEKYARMSEVVGDDLVTCVQSLLDRLELENPFPGQELRDQETVIEETLASGSTKANPRPVTAEDVRRMLDAIFEKHAGG